jgi:hypothetical protein
VTVFTEYRLGMELHPFNGQFPVPESHDLVDGAVLVRGPGTDLEAVGNRLSPATTRE